MGLTLNSQEGSPEGCNVKEVSRQTDNNGRFLCWEFFLRLKSTLFSSIFSIGYIMYFLRIRRFLFVFVKNSNAKRGWSEFFP